MGRQGKCEVIRGGHVNSASQACKEGSLAGLCGDGGVTCRIRGLVENSPSRHTPRTGGVRGGSLSGAAQVTMLPCERSLGVLDCSL